MNECRDNKGTYKCSFLCKNKNGEEIGCDKSSESCCGKYYISGNYKKSIKSCLTKNPFKLSRYNKNITGVSDAAFFNDSEWSRGSNINIHFLRDAYYTPYKAKWTKYVITKYLSKLVSLNFQWDSPLKNSHIRITFNSAQGAWSELGKLPPSSSSEPTMALGWLDDDVDYDMDEVRGTGIVICHEFGHMLGLIHEHQRSDITIEWNKDYVYKTLGGPPNNWSRQTVDSNIFEAMNKSSFNGSEYDKNSMMHYFFECCFFKNPLVGTLPKNTKLSFLDKKTIFNKYNTEPFNPADNYEVPDSENPRPVRNANEPIGLGGEQNGDNMKIVMVLVIILIIVMMYIIFKMM